MKYPKLDKNNVFIGMFEAILATPPDVGLYLPSGTIDAQGPPTNEQCKWLWENNSWRELTAEDLIEIYMHKVQARLDNFARSEGKAYDNMLSACTYATSTNPVFGAEGQYCVEARDNTWAAAYQIMNEVLSGQRPVPAWNELEAELPELVWPGARSGEVNLNA